MEASKIPHFTRHKINIINNINEISPNINDLLKHNETIITNYVERYIYNALLSDIIKEKIQLIYNTIDIQFKLGVDVNTDVPVAPDAQHNQS